MFTIFNHVLHCHGPQADICCPLPVASANMVSLCPTNDILQHHKTSQIWFIFPIISVATSCPLWICVTNHPILVSQKPSTYIWGRYKCEIKGYDLPEERACQVIQYHSHRALLCLTRPPPAISNYLLVGLQGDKHKHKIQRKTRITTLQNLPARRIQPFRRNP